VDQSTQRLYIADVDVFDVSKDPPGFVTSIRLGHAPHGLAVAGDLRKVSWEWTAAVLEADPSSRGVNRVLTVIQTSARKRTST